MKDPAKSEKAVAEPKEMAHSAEVMMPTKIVDGMGQDKVSLTFLNMPENGTALSRASAHQVRPTVRKVPIKHGISDKKMMKRRPNVADVLPVA